MQHGSHFSDHGQFLRVDIQPIVERLNESSADVFSWRRCDILVRFYESL